jgi:hypothetical protein
MPVRRTHPGRAVYRRTSFFVDVRAIARARQVLGADSNAEAVRLAVDRVVEMERFWRFMNATRRTLGAGSIDAP